MRVFFGVEIGEEARAAAAGLARELRRAPGADHVRWVRAEAYHLTLRFLGEAPRERIDPLAAAAAAELAPLGAFRLRLGALSALPTPRRARVVVLGVEPEAPLAELAAHLERACVAEGFPAEARAFRAHLTLGRVRGAPPRLDWARAAPAVVFPVSEVVLFESRLQERGSVYVPLARLPLLPAKGSARPASDSSRHSASEGDPHGTQL